MRLSDFRLRNGLLGVAVVILTLIGSTLARANENKLCLVCHKKDGITGTRGDDEISVHVDPGLFASSVHAKLGCTECHRDVDPEDIPHEDELKPATCTGCHEHDEQVKQHERSRHGQAAAEGDPLAPSCAGCHGTHGILSHRDRNSPTSILRIPSLCGKCHHEGSDVSLTHEIPQDRILENYSQSIHGAGLFKQGLTVTAVCISCHTSHLILPHTDPDSSINPRNVAATCQKCHGLIELVHRQVIEGRDWETEKDKIPACVDCHSPHKPRPDKKTYQAQRSDCFWCHGEAGRERSRLKGEPIAPLVDERAYDASMHREVECAQCHTEVSAIQPGTTYRTRQCDTIRSKVNCAACHEEAEVYKTSTHGHLHAAGDTDAPTCIDCHAKHATLSQKQPESPTFPRNVPQLCGRCHRAGQQAAIRIDSEVADIVGSYRDSIHGKGLVESGLTVTATCASCHSAHAELPSSDPKSTVHHDNVAATCGQCHHGIEETFRSSVHWPGNAETDRELPSCRDCHSSHRITRKDQADFRFRMMDQCGRCHEEEASTFFDTAHGKKTRLGWSAPAKCYDCHGTHDIRPVTDPLSTLSRANIVETCAKCHEGAHRRFAGYLTHATHHDPDKYPYLFWTFWGMTGLLVGTLVVAVIHTLAWLVRLWLTRGEWTRHRPVAGEKLYRRFGRAQRTMHLLMLISFFTLALTGMSLKFAYMPWAEVISSVLGGARSMGILHRMGGILLFAVFFLHLWDVRRKMMQSGRTMRQMLTGPDTVMFGWHDLREFWQSLKWFVGRGPRPQFGRYTYWEKFDYMAVFWGIAVIGSTGLVLWFPESFTHWMPGWCVNVATIIHSDEALLAVGFIFTIHFFNTHFRPDKFPMDPVIFTGRVPLEELKHDKPREYARLVASGELEEHLVDAFPKRAERAARIFGFTFLAIGLTLIGLIVYSVLFGYR